MNSHFIKGCVYFLNQSEICEIYKNSNAKGTGSINDNLNNIFYLKNNREERAILDKESYKQ